jgi:hypothetical protein
MALAIAVVLVSGRSGAGHSIGHFPSYYPDEIRIDAMAPEAAATGLADQTLHAYVGAVPKFTQPAPAHVKSVKSLGAFVVLTFDERSRIYELPQNRCVAGQGIMVSLGRTQTGGFVYHPYPVTPYHADHLHHLDRVEAARRSFPPSDLPPANSGIAAHGPRAEAIVRSTYGRVASDEVGVALEVVPVESLLSGQRVALDGGLGPPWAKEGWFQAYRLIAPFTDGPERQALEEAYQRLVHGDLRGGLAERVELERRLVRELWAPCHRRQVVGYIPREEFFNEAYPPGVENVAYDAISGLNAPIFVRTAKLKEYPWNGKLHLGVPDAPRAAWNPVAGFTDGMGRLLWSAVGDTAMIPLPVNASWMPNRVQADLSKVEGRSGGIKMPADALRPEPGTGQLQPVGTWAFASEKITYEVAASPYDDGTDETAADVLYPYAFLYRWGAKAEGGDRTSEPRLAPTFAAIDEQLAGVKVVRVDRTTHTIAEGLEVVATTPVVDVYLRGAPADQTQAAALAAPGGTVPWHVLALMDAAVARGFAAFSEEEARARGVPWLDVVRDPALNAKLLDLVAQFEREAFVPVPLQALVGADEARERWRALKAYAEKNGHFLVANGPYRLKSWAPDGVVLEAVREMTYPLGFGTFDRLVYPPRALIDEVTQDDRSITVRASAEMTLKGGRGTTHVTEPLQHTTARGTYPLLVISRYLLADAAGKVLKADKMRWREDGLFTIDLPQDLPPGDYTVMLAIFLDGNAVDPSARTLHFRRIGASGSPG